ncbi:MAG: alpha/beta hydrolase-fold protein [Gemmatimonadales bacterium]|nr:alpha/beta hydrolase-fold protein [Gemmatimonadales bacterium]
MHLSPFTQRSPPISLPLPALIDLGAPAAPILVLLHGRGATEEDLFPLGRMLHPEATIVAPRAPFEAAPWGYGPGWAWYRFLSGTTPEPESFTEGQQRLDEFLAALPGHLDRPDAPLLLGGFSQGGTSSLAWALRHPGLVAKVLVFSGFLATHPMVAVTPATVATTPIWWGHGTADPAIPFQHALLGWQQLQAAGAELTTRQYDGMGHTIGRDALREAAMFLK